MKMSRQIIEQDEAEKEGAYLVVNTFWGGSVRKECVQLTAIGELNDKGFSTMTRTDALSFFKTIVKRLEEQLMSDHENPPWWQEIDKEKEKRRIKTRGFRARCRNDD